MSPALIMAGGESSRMRKTTNQKTHKALVEVFNISLLEINILYAYVYGFNHIWVSVAKIELELIERIRYLQELYLRNLDLKIELIIEDTPLGTIGAVQFIENISDDLLVLNVDNILNIDLTDFMLAHRNSRADMTIASHEEPFKIPFGQLLIRNGCVIDYLEKPVQKIVVSSGTYILGNCAREMIRRSYSNERLDIPEFSKFLLANGSRVQAYSHNSVWADINDKESLLKITVMDQWPLLKEIGMIQKGLE